MTERESKGGKKVSRHRWWLLAFVILVALLLLSTYLTFGSRGGEKLRMVRQHDGTMVLVEGERGSWFDVHAGVSWENRDWSSSSTVSGSFLDPLSARTIWITCLSDDDLTRQVGLLLLDELALLPFVDELVYFPPESRPGDSERLPDLFVSVDLVESSGIQLPGFMKMKAKVGITVGKTPWPTVVGHFTDPKAPNKEVCLLRTVQYEGTGLGFYSNAAKSMAAARSIVGSNELMEEFISWFEDGGVLPALPDGFYGKSSASQNLSADALSGTTLFAGGPGFLAHNESIFCLEPGEEAIRTVDELKKELLADGWKVDAHQKEGLTIGTIQLTRGSSELKICERKPFGVFYMPPGEEILEKAGSPERLPQVEETKGSLCIYYVDRFLPGEAAAAVDSLIAEGASIEVLAPFFSLMEEDQKRAVAERFATALSDDPLAVPNDPRILLTLAHLFHGDVGDDDMARRLVRRSAAALFSIWDQREIEEKLKELAEELGDESLAEPPKDVAVFEEVGFVKLTLEEGSVTREISLDEPVCFLISSGGGETNVVSLTVVSDIDGDAENTPYEIHCIERKLGERGASMSGQNGSLEGSPARWMCRASNYLDDVFMEYSTRQRKGFPVRFDLEVRLRRSGGN